ncbi:glycosyltransferase [Antarcticibacterium arcticum]|uniref:Glycosyltransferase n=1 Tax=Antarcticibacterium arcticum TaxID=2585771 RepID=A0A5B8YJC6_9FLAO|nr:glycosyltransferase [Antarcticibacterium arcticum]QED37741.1 glycosyltransferase [Antarcticibacterium arcticum]
MIPEVKVERGKWKEDSQDGLGGVESGLLDTFQKNRQFECLPDSPEGERGNVSRTGFSETPAYRQGRLEVTSGKNESQYMLEETVQKIIELLKDPEEMRRMSMEAQEWSQQYTLEKFENAIKEILKSDKVSNNKSSSSFGRGGVEG